MNYGFFDMNLMGISRYPALIAKDIAAQAPTSSFTFFYEQTGSLSEQEVLALLPKNSVLIKVSTVTGRSIKKQLSKCQLKTLTVMAQRIPDTAFVLAAKELGIHTVMYQHGLYIPFIKRETSLLVNQVRKVFRFVCYVNAVSALINKSFITTLFNYIQVFLLGKNITKTGLPFEKLNVERVLVYGEYWKQYHRDVFGYSIEQQDTVGYPELKSLTNEKENIISPGVCYITQTLVEDGRLDRQILIDFLKRLALSCENNKQALIIKLHPRSDLSIYKNLSGNVVFERQCFPISDIYVGHYSSLVAKAAYVTNNILLIDFPGHDIPEYIKSISAHRLFYNESEKITEALAGSQVKDEKVVEQNKAKLESIFGNSTLDSVHNVATYLKSYKC